MLDIKAIREDKDRIQELLQTKESDVDLTPILALDDEIRELKTDVEALKAKRNDGSKKIGELKRAGEDCEALMQEMSQYGEQIAAKDQRLQELTPQFNDLMARLPNIPMEDIKVSEDPADNVCIKEVGSKPEWDFEPKNHVELNEKLHLFDFKRGVRIAGSGWPAYRGMGARLEWALIQYMIDTHIKNGWTFWLPPLCNLPETLYNSGQLPKFKDQLFRINDEDYDLCLVPTAEVALNGLHAGEILSEDELPLRYCAYTPCFRREAGAAGANERGMIRIHQFNKVELFAYTKPGESMAMFDEIVSAAESILEGLELHYRNMLLVTGDMSFGSARTVDVEVWLPGQDRYYEVSSVSNCTDFQARRSLTRYRRKEDKKPSLVHTLNGSGLATSRLMVALLENNQNSDGSVRIPKVLQKYLGGIDKLEPAASSDEQLVTS